MEKDINKDINSIDNINWSDIESEALDEEYQNKDQEVEEEEVLEINPIGNWQDKEGWLQNEDFLYFISNIYSKDLLKNCKKDYFDLAVEFYKIGVKYINNGTMEDIDDVINFAHTDSQSVKFLKEYEDDARKTIEKQNAKKEHDEMIKREKESLNIRYKKELWDLMKTIGEGRVYRPFEEFYLEGNSKKPIEKKLITQELAKDNRDFSSIIVKDYHEKFELLSVRDYLKDYIKFIVYRSVSSEKGVLSEEEIRNTFNNSIKPLAEEINKKYFKETMPYDNKMQELIDDKKQVYNLKSSDRINLLKDLKNSILESLDNKYDTKYEYLLTTQKQKFKLMKEAVYNQSIWKKIFRYSTFLKEKQELIEVSDRLCSSLHISKDKLFKTMDEDSNQYIFFTQESKALYDAAKNDLEDLIKEVKDKGVYKAEIKVEEVKREIEHEVEKDLSNVKDLNLEFEIIDNDSIDIKK